MKSISSLFVLLFISFVLVSCAEQNALTKENQDKESDTNVNASFLEKQETEADITVKHKILITPFEYVSTNSKYSNPEIYKTIIFSSFYNLFSVLPTIDLPDKSELLSLNPSDDTISNLANKYQCDFIVFGDYGLKGDKSKPNAVINLKIWNKLSGAIMTDSITTPTDIDLFDAIDSLMSKMVRTMLNEEMKIAYLNFNNFDTGNENIGIFINHKLVAEPISNNFKLSMKILSGKKYNVSIRRMFDGKLLSGAFTNLKPGETMNFSATNYRVNLIKNGEFDKVSEALYLKNTGDAFDIIQKLFEPEDIGKWHLITMDSAEAEVKIESGNCYIKIKNCGLYWNSMVFDIASVKIEYGKNYRLSFMAKSTDIREIGLKIGRHGNGWYNYIGINYRDRPKYFPINTEMKEYNCIFKMNYLTDEKGYLEIFLHDSTNDVWIKNVMVEELD